jgi:uncharacterized membrane protein
MTYNPNPTPTQVTLTPEQQVDRYRNRRRMAWLAFNMIAIFGIGLIIAGVSSDPIANRINTISVLVGMIFGVWVSIVLSYFTATVVTDVKGIK